MLLKEIAQIIKNRRLENNMSLETLSKLTDISISSLNKIENNKVKELNSVFLYRLCKTLNLDYEEVLRFKWEVFPVFKYERDCYIGSK